MNSTNVSKMEDCIKRVSEESDTNTLVNDKTKKNKISKKGCICLCITNFIMIVTLLMSIYGIVKSMEYIKDPRYTLCTCVGPLEYDGYISIDCNNGKGISYMYAKFDKEDEIILSNKRNNQTCYQNKNRITFKEKFIIRMEMNENAAVFPLSLIGAVISFSVILFILLLITM